MNFDLTACHLYGILDLGYVEPSRALEVTRAMLAGGVQILQLRAKKIPPAEILQLAQILASVCRAAGVPFILNDHPELVGPSGADGVHVGQDDQSVAEARRLAGPGKLVGLSTHSPAQARDAFEQKPDYIGFGPLFSTPTKPDYTPIGTADIADIHRDAPLPIFCIGGIKLENLPQILATGAQRVVIVSGILQASDISTYCLESLRLLRGNWR
ncbi:MAG: thiamine phosphate synthase [Verrucomicrobiota bacterium]|jgi:thiamine-phosphate pyrophosphorylase